MTQNSKITNKGKKQQMNNAAKTKKNLGIDWFQVALLLFSIIGDTKNVFSITKSIMCGSFPGDPSSIIHAGF